MPTSILMPDIIHRLAVVITEERPFSSAASLALPPTPFLCGVTACSLLSHFLYVVMRAWQVVYLLEGVLYMVLADVGMDIHAAAIQVGGENIFAHIAAGDDGAILTVKF
jgi:hypothetical protein